MILSHNAMVAPALNESSDSKIIDLVVRMVVPMRREFGRQLDVRQFMHDSDYARVVIDEALTSKDERLLKYAAYIRRRLLSARVAVTPQDLLTGPAHESVPPKPMVEETEEALRNRVLDKYRRGLR